MANKYTVAKESPKERLMKVQATNYKTYSNNYKLSEALQ